MMRNIASCEACFQIPQNLREVVIMTRSIPQIGMTCCASCIQHDSVYETKPYTK